MGRIWVPLKQPPHPSGISGLSTDGEKVLRALTQRHREKISTQTSANTKPGMWQIGVFGSWSVVAQWLGHRPWNLRVVSSILTGSPH